MSNEILFCSALLSWIFEPSVPVKLDGVITCNSPSLTGRGKIIQLFENEDWIIAEIED